MQVVCSACRVPFQAKRSTAKFCSPTCRKRDSRSPHTADVGDFEAQTRKELERLRKLDSMLGQQAMVIARRMTNGTETGSAVATLSKEHSRLMAAVTGKGQAADPVDEVRKRRDAKVARATTG